MIAGHKMYGMYKWNDLFSARQLLCHGTSVEVYREMLDADRVNGELNDVRKVAYGYLAFSIDKSINWNARVASWNVKLQGMRSVFDRHNFSFKWSYAEMAPLIVGVGYDWTIRQTAKCIDELVALVRPDTEGVPADLFAASETAYAPPPITVTCKPGDSLDHIDDDSIDAVVMDPPYYDNVMYAELSDFFYVLAQAHGWPCLSRVVPWPSHRQGQRGRGQSGEIQGARRAQRRSPDETTRSAWHPSSPSAAGC